MSNRSVMVCHAPNELYEQTKDIAEKEMISISEFCRMAVKSMVQDYRNNAVQSEQTHLESASVF